MNHFLLWQRHSIEDLLSENVLYIGDGYRAKRSELAKTGLPFARAGNINQGFQFLDAERFPEKDLGKVGLKVSQPGDVVFTSKGTVGRFAFVHEDTERFVYAPQLSFWRVLNRAIIEPHFLYYWMFSREFYSQIRGLKGQTDMADYVSLQDQRRMDITLPSLDEQRRIAAVLSTLDAKIDLLRRQNHTLEQIAQTLFKRWFVEFEFPVAVNSEERIVNSGGSEKRIVNSEELDNYSLFTNHPSLTYKSSGGPMVASELGEIPEGWRVGTLGEEFDILMGQSPSGESYNEIGEGMVFFQGRTDFGFRFPSIRLYTTEPNRVANRFDVLVSVRAPVGDVNVAFEQCCVGRGLAAVKGEFKSYCFYKIKSYQRQFDVFESEGTVFGSLNKNSFNGLLNVIPLRETVSAFEKISHPIDLKIFNNENQIRILTRLRDTLLPKLMSGQLRVNRLK